MIALKQWGYTTANGANNFNIAFTKQVFIVIGCRKDVGIGASKTAFALSAISLTQFEMVAAESINGQWYAIGV